MIGKVTPVGTHWASELARKPQRLARPASAGAGKQPPADPSFLQKGKSPARRDNVVMPPDWDYEKEAVHGQGYRWAYLGERRQLVDALREQLKGTRRDVQRLARRLAQSKHCLSVAERFLSKKDTYGEGSIGARPQGNDGSGTSSLGNLSMPGNSTEGGESSTQQVCQKCGVDLQVPSNRYCGGCLHAVYDELNYLRQEVGPMLSERAQLRMKLESNDRELTAFDGSSLASNAEKATREHEQGSVILNLLIELRTLQYTLKAQTERDDERQVALTTLDQESEERRAKASARLHQARRMHRHLEFELKGNLSAINEELAATERILGDGRAEKS